VKLRRLRQLAEGLPGSGWVQPQDLRVLLRRGWRPWGSPGMAESGKRDGILREILERQEVGGYE